ncbi:MAG: hypothetical protein II997_08390 [Clostridia bacterium]|nr:hypothetical protein [Clostridia bacterium]
MGKQYKSGKSSGGKKILLTIGVLALLVLLFFLSFWITGIVLRANQGPLISQEATETGAPTPKPTYEELEKTVIEQNERIEELEKELASYRLDGTPAPNKTTAPSFTTGQNPTAKPKETPVAKPSVKPTAKPTAVPTAKPTVAPTPVPTAAPAAPTKTPVQILPPGLQ